MRDSITSWAYRNALKGTCSAPERCPFDSRGRRLDSAITTTENCSETIALGSKQVCIILLIYQGKCSDARNSPRVQGNGRGQMLE